MPDAEPSSAGAPPPERWAAAVAENLARRSQVVELLDENRRVTKQAKADAAKLRDFENSQWWKATGPLRKTTGKRHRNKQSVIAPESDPTSYLDDSYLEILHERLLVVIAALNIAAPEEASAASALSRVLAHLDETDDQAGIVWLLAIVVRSQFPTSEQMQAYLRTFRFVGADAMLGELAEVGEGEDSSWAHNAPIQIVQHTSIDVTHTSTSEFHTGIQRVVREVVPRWNDAHQLQLIKFDVEAQTFRTLTNPEIASILRWGQVTSTAAFSDHQRSPEPHIIIPWNTEVLLLEFNGNPKHADALATVADFTRSRLHAVSYDLIPFVYSEGCAIALPRGFARHMTGIRRCERVSAISGAVGDDLAGYLSSAHNVGMPQPTVRTQVLPVQSHSITPEALAAGREQLIADAETPLVLIVASLEGRKNLATSLSASEILWREGLNFQLVYIVGSYRNVADNLRREIDRALENGRPLTLLNKVNDDLLWAGYHLARFTVFVSLAEGFGLPAAESLAAGTPVVLTNYGSMHEIGDAGGVEFVNPRDVDSVAAGMRRLLTSNERLEQLREQARNRPTSSWDKYATDLWSWLVDGR